MAEPEIIVQHFSYPSKIGNVTHLSVQRKDGKELVVNWDFFNKIKEEEFGVETQMIEIYPKKSLLVNYANIRHFWILPSNYKIPFST